MIYYSVFNRALAILFLPYMETTSDYHFTVVCICTQERYVCLRNWYKSRVRSRAFCKSI